MKKKILKYFHIEFKSMRVGRGLTQKDFADTLGQDSCQFISNIERGKSYLSKPSLKKLCRKFNMDYVFLARLIVEEQHRNKMKYWLGV